MLFTIDTSIGDDDDNNDNNEEESVDFEMNDSDGDEKTLVGERECERECEREQQLLRQQQADEVHQCEQAEQLRQLNE